MKRVLEGGGSVDKMLDSYLVGVLNPVSYKGLYKGCDGLMAFSSLARIWEECWTIHYPPALAHTNSTLYARISPQWLSELR